MGVIDDYIRIKKPGDLGYHVDKIVRDYSDIHEHIKQNPKAKEGLESLFENKYQENRKMYEAAKLLDSFNRWIVAPVDILSQILAPFTAGASYFASVGARVASGLAGIAYAAYYTFKTGDPYVAAGGVAQAAAAQFLPAYGGVAFTAPVYSKLSQRYLQRDVADAFRKRYMSNVIDLKPGASQDLEEKVAPRKKAA